MNENIKNTRYAMYSVPVVIPCYEPDERLTELLEELCRAGIRPVILVNDGSGPEYDACFENALRIIRPSGGVLLSHAVNQGKGRSLKDAFRYILQQMPEAAGCITADSDGQHTVACIQKCLQVFRDHPDELILGSRDFTSANVPAKSRQGNRISRFACRFLCGIAVSDTQTGLRGIPVSFMRRLLDIPGDRFEFEMEMLLASRDTLKIREVPIETVYDSRENHSTHFDPLRDSLRISRVFGRVFGKFIFSSVSSSVLDLALFALFCWLLKGRFFGDLYPAAATVCARILSALYNYLINYKIVFRSTASKARSVSRYAILAAVQMLCSAGLVTILLMLFRGAPELAVKIPVDTFLFFISYYIQHEFVFR
jgi:glycosyltransferase involved in cell wall biosynthesis